MKSYTLNCARARAHARANDAATTKGARHSKTKIILTRKAGFMGVSRSILQLPNSGKAGD